MWLKISVLFTDFSDLLLLSSSQIETETMAPPDYTFPEEEKPEEEEEEELVLKPQAIPQGSGGSGVLMGPETHKGLKNMPTWIKEVVMSVCGAILRVFGGKFNKKICCQTPSSYFPNACFPFN